MTDPVRQPATLSPAPRHLRKRRFRPEVATSLMAGYQQHSPANPSLRPAQTRGDSKGAVKAAPPIKESTRQRPEPREVTLRQKRLIALLVVILVSISIPILLLTLIFAP
ncbi:hypothetical protein ACFRJ9_11690 [Paenarthrobacter sp. NPDC056912]|uniref:hypothetical protein n=1 Tax=Paenarthrobacter sp. NPDC056912 TaxID=3345965 RepID=UPI0036715F24